MKMRTILELLTLIAFVMALPAIPLAIGNFLQRRRHPEDGKLYDMYMERARKSPDSFTVECDSSIEAKDDVFKATSYGSLQAARRSLSLSMWQDIRVSRSVRRLWKHHGRTDQKKKALIDKLSVNG